MFTYHFEVNGVYSLYRYELDFEVSINEFIHWAKKYWIFAKFGELENPEIDGTPNYCPESDSVRILTKGTCSVEADSYEEAIEEMNGTCFEELYDISFDFSYEE